MHIILTHEQADFDALGASLGAYLLNEKAIPILPRRINRNGRAFVTLYGAELPFVEARDLPPEPIETVTLVDTQSLNTMKGMSAATRVHVIDHHPLRRDLPENWIVRGERLGACTTHFVEIISEHNGNLSVINATLLLLGIYEDSGSLTYVGTTPRDIRAAAYLLERGASLRIANQYLNPPLSPEQRRVYDLLLSVAETHTIHGHTVVLACANMEEMTEEISSVAHKLRDLLDPDALLLLVQTNEGIRLVARSTNDQINVASIAAEFGGGGHDRAAGALLQPEDIGESSAGDSLTLVRQKLLDVLPRYILPSITVSQLMSRKPLVLSPKTSAQEAAELMKRYGYEGYPVVEDGTVIGLLTRRAVDRAISHKLNLTAGSLMDAGEVTVHPTDALEHLQKLMTSTGWGQVPVVDPQTNQLIGIVTRTDLLKMLAGGENHFPESQNLASRLEAALPAARLALLHAVANLAHSHHQAIYIVGGFARDLLLDRPSLDFDIVVEGDAIALGEALVKKFGGKMTSHKRFGTAKWQLTGIISRLCQELPLRQPFHASDLPESLDLISARTEFYNYPTALPVVERGSIKLDLHRRDFTINTMALRLDGKHYGELYDYWGGLADLRRGLVRALHSLSFVDDPTRMLRAVRFEQRFGFNIENRTLQLMREAQPMLRQVSGQRLTHELNLILLEAQPADMLNRLQELGLLSAIHPLFNWKSEWKDVLQSVLTQQPDPEWALPASAGRLPLKLALAYLVWLASLPLNDSQAITNRLRLPSCLLEALASLNRLSVLLPELVAAPISEIVSQLDKAPLIALYVIYQITASEQIRKLIHQYLVQWRKIKSVTDGNRLRDLNLKPGPVYQQILTSLRNAWLDGRISSSQEEDVMLQQLLPIIQASNRSD